MEVSPAVDQRGSPGTLVERIIQGDRAAETELVERFRRGVALILARETHGSGVHDDLLQDTFQVALEKIRRGEVREPEKIAGFICNLARNLAIDHFRRESRHESAGRELPGDAGDSPDPLQQVLAAERAAIARRVLEELQPERDRQVLYRFYIAEQDKEQICAELGLTSLHFNRVLFRARQRYRELYEKSHAAHRKGMG